MGTSLDEVLQELPQERQDNIEERSQEIREEVKMLRELRSALPRSGLAGPGPGDPGT